MKAYAQQASVRWMGTRQRGKGVLRTPSAALKLALHAAGGNLKRRGTNPLELMAAAHAGSFALTLAGELAEAGFGPRQIDTSATVTMEQRAGGWTLTQIHLDIVATVPKVAECDFVDAALRAKANCPIARALNANVSMRAHLNRHEALPAILSQHRPGTSGRRKAPTNRPRRTNASHSGGRLRGGR
jgi:lipoyl-dependent peroxiredoxin